MLTVKGRAMRDEAIANDFDGDPMSLSKIDALSDWLEQEWKADRRPTLEVVLAHYGRPTSEQLFRELLETEIGLRLKFDPGQAPRATDYLQRFPQFEQTIREVLQSRTPAEVDTLLIPGHADLNGVPGTPTPGGPVYLSDHQAALGSGDALSDDEGEASAGNALGEIANGTQKLEKLGDYILSDPPLAEGGMGVVYKAKHQYLERIYALKILASHLMRNKNTAERFKLEMKLTAAMEHPNIVQATDAGEDQGMLYLVMELVRALDLQTVLDQNKPLPVPFAVDLVRQVAEALEYAHSVHQVVHRDIKPGNVLLRRNGTIKVLDFGLARVREIQGTLISTDPEARRLTAAGHTMGTPDYMSPEQVEGRLDVDIRADVYSLGCTLYALLTGRGPFDDQAHSALVKKLQAQINEEPAPLAQLRPGVPEPVQRMVERMMAKSRDLRYTTPGEVAIDLQNWLEQTEADTSVPDWLVSLLPEGDTKEQNTPPPKPVVVPLEDPPPITSGVTPPPEWSVSWWMVVLFLVVCVGSAGFLTMALNPEFVASLGSAWSTPTAPEETPEGGRQTPKEEPQNPPQDFREEKKPEPPQVVAPLEVALSIDRQAAEDEEGYNKLLGSRLPVMQGDKFQLHAKLSQPAYLYLLWYDAQGKATVMWPKAQDWDQQKKVEELWDPKPQPGSLQRWYSVGGTSGYELILAAARDTPLSRSELAELKEYRCLLCGLDPTSKLVSLSKVDLRGLGSVVESKKVGEDQPPKTEAEATQLALVIPKPNPPPHAVVALRHGDVPTLAIQEAREIQGPVDRGPQGEVISRKVKVTNQQRFENIVLGRFPAYHGLIYPFMNPQGTP